MLTNEQIDRLITIEQWLEEIQDSPEFEALDYHPGLTVGDARQAIADLLDAQKPSNFTPSEDKPVMRLYRVRPWHEKLRDRVFVGLGEVAVTSLIVAALNGCAWLTCWGLSDIDKATGNRFKPDFAAQSQMYRGLAIASVGFSLGCSTCASAIARGGKDA